MNNILTRQPRCELRGARTPARPAPRMKGRLGPFADRTRRRAGACVEVTAAIPAGPVKLMAVGRFLSDVYDDGLDESKWAVGGGATIRVSDNVALAGDVVALADRAVGSGGAGAFVSGGELDVAWSAALQLGVPFTPHTFSIQVTNARTASLQGSSFGDGQIRYGFEFTIPFTLSRYFGGREGTAQEGPSGDVAAEVSMSVSGLPILHTCGHRKLHTWRFDLAGGSDLPPRAVPHPMIVPAPVEGREGRASSGTRATA